MVTFAKQSRAMSFAEAVTNVAVGVSFALVAQITVFPMFGIAISLANNLLIAVIFTAVSVIRSFTLRRMFEALRMGAWSDRRSSRS